MDLVIKFGGSPLTGREAHVGRHTLKKVMVVPVKATQNNLK